MQERVAARLAQAGYRALRDVGLRAAGPRRARTTSTTGASATISASARARMRRSRSPTAIVREVRWKQPQQYLERVAAGEPLMERREVARDELGFEFMLNALRLTEGVRGVDCSPSAPGYPLAIVARAIDEGDARGLLVADPTRIAADGARAAIPQPTIGSCSSRRAGARARDRARVDRPTERRNAEAPLTLAEARRDSRRDATARCATPRRCSSTSRRPMRAIRAWAHLDPRMGSQRSAAHATRCRVDARGPLRGMPRRRQGHHPIRATLPTRMGSPAFAGLRRARDAACVERLRAAGGYVFGKTVTTELAFMHPGKTRNPWNARTRRAARRGVGRRGRGGARAAGARDADQRLGHPAGRVLRRRRIQADARRDSRSTASICSARRSTRWARSRARSPTRRSLANALVDAAARRRRRPCAAAARVPAGVSVDAASMRRRRRRSRPRPRACASPAPTSCRSRCRRGCTTRPRVHRTIMLSEASRNLGASAARDRARNCRTSLNDALDEGRAIATDDYRARCRPRRDDRAARPTGSRTTTRCSRRGAGRRARQASTRPATRPAARSRRCWAPGDHVADRLRCRASAARHAAVRSAGKRCQTAGRGRLVRGALPFRGLA